MSVQTNTAGLFLVPPPGSAAKESSRPQYGPGSVIVMALGQFGDSDLVRVLEEAHPGNIFELRMTPRFDIGSLNRRKAFALFKAHDAKYFDISAAAADLEGAAQIDAMVGALAEVMDKAKDPHQRPILLFTGMLDMASRGNGIILETLSIYGAGNVVVLS